MCIGGGPTAYESDRDPHPLSETEQAILAFAACGLTGPALGDWSYEPGSGGNMLAGFAGRTVGRADAIRTLSVFVVDDDATRLARRPRDLEPDELRDVVELTDDGDLPVHQSWWRR